MIKLIVSISFLLLSHLSYCQTLNWANSYEGSVNGQYHGTTQFIKSTGRNLFWTGNMSDSIDFDPTAGIDKKAWNTNQTNVFIQKADTSGNVEKTIAYRPNLTVNALEIVDTIVLFYCRYSVAFDIDPGSNVHMLPAPSGGDKFFLAAFDLDLNFLWVKTWWSPSLINSGRMVITPEKKILMSGRFFGTFDLDPGPNVMNHTANSTVSGYILNLDINGNYLWSKSYETDYFSNVFNISIATDGFIAAVVFKDSLDFDFGSGQTKYAEGNGDFKVSFAKYNYLGDYLWHKVFQGPFSTSNSFSFGSATQFALDKMDNIFVYTWLAGVQDFNPDPALVNSHTSNGSTDIVVVKFDNMGIYQKSIQIGAENPERAFHMSIDKYANLVLSGYMNSASVDFDPSVNTQLLNGSGQVNGPSLGFYAKYNANLELLALGSLGDASTYVDVLSHVIDPYHRLVFSGSYQGTVDFDPSSGVDNRTAVSPNGDLFLTSRDICGGATTHSFSETACTQYTLPSGRRTYTQSGTYIDTVTNYLGCDSILTIQLTIIAPVLSSQTLTACNQFVSPTGKIWSVTGIYEDTLQTTVGCDSIITFNLTIPVFDLNVLNDDPTLVALMNNAQYQWLDCNNNFSPITGAVFQAFSPQTSGTYAVQLTNQGCKDTSACETIATASLDEAMAGSLIQLYPNPASEYIEVKLPEGTTLNFHLKLLDPTGKTVLETEVIQSMQINVSHLARGMYYVHLGPNQKDSQSVYKIILQ